MKKLPKILLFLVVSVFLLVGSAWALPYTPSMLDIHGWVLTGATNNSGTSGGTLAAFINTTENDVYSFGHVYAPKEDIFNVTFEQSVDQNYKSLPYNGGALIGSTSAVDLSSWSNDSFQLRITNHNESPWDYALYVANDADHYFIGVGSTQLSSTSGFLRINNGSSAVLSLDLTAASSSGVDLSGVYIGFAVGNNLPAGTSDRPDYVSETGVAPVPEPATMLLFGIGLCGLAFVGRKKLLKEG